MQRLLHGCSSTHTALYNWAAAGAVTKPQEGPLKSCLLLSASELFFQSSESEARPHPPAAPLLLDCQMRHSIAHPREARGGAQPPVPAQNWAGSCEQPG